MKRSDRLMAILMALQQRQETAQSLADKLEVSRRTILRDMQSLSEIGVPLYAVAGASGGYRLMDGYALPPLQLDAQEALAALLALKATTKLADTPFNRARWTVIDKLRAALPADTLSEVEPLLEQVELAVPERRAKTPLLSALLGYASRGEWIRADYRSERHRRELLLEPLRLYTAHGYWYCEAYSANHGEQRTFRVDRFESAEAAEPPTAGASAGDKQGNGAPAQVKAAPALASAADTGAVSTATDTRMGASTSDEPSSFRLHARLTYRGALLAEQDEHFGEQVKQLSDELWELDFQCPTADRGWAARLFYSLGMDAEVIEPASMRDEIYRMCEQLAGRYRPAEGEC